MSNIKALPDIDILITADGSPTLSLNSGEKMHSMKGALAETLYVYAPCIEKSIILGKPIVLSMGLGIGYNELLSLAYFYKHQLSKFKILSFEKEDFLIKNFRLFLSGDSSELSDCYNLILDKISEHFKCDKNKLLAYSLDALKSNKLTLNGPLEIKSKQQILCNAILYDAFSNETDSELWTQSNLQTFIQNYCAKKDCTFSSYASTGDLKRALKSEGFHIEKKVGFAKKREATLAYR